MSNDNPTIHEEAAEAIEAMTNDDLIEWLEELGLITPACYDDLVLAEMILAKASDDDPKIASRIVYD